MMMGTSVASAVVVSSGHPPKTASWIAFVTIGLVALVFAWGPLYLWWALGRGEQGDGDSDSDSGGGGWGGGNNRPPKSPPETDPEWWPEFERQFEQHVQGRRLGTERRQTLPAERSP